MDSKTTINKNTIGNCQQTKDKPIACPKCGCNLVSQWKNGNPEQVVYLAKCEDCHIVFQVKKSTS